MITPAVTAVEGKGRGAEAGGQGGGRSRVEVANQFPRFGIEGRIRARRAGEGRLVDEQDFAERGVGR